MSKLEKELELLCNIRSLFYEENSYINDQSRLFNNIINIVKCASNYNDIEVGDEVQLIKQPNTDDNGWTPYKDLLVVGAKAIVDRITYCSNDEYDLQKNFTYWIKFTYKHSKQGIVFGFTKEYIGLIHE